MRRLLAGVALGVVVAGFFPGVAQAEDTLSPAAKEKYDKGVAAFGARDYEGAVEALRAAYALDPKPDILFAWAQAERLNGNCPGAIPLYKKFLGQRPEGVQADAVKQPLARCERAVASKTIEEPSAEQPSATPPPVSKPEPTPAKAEPAPLPSATPPPADTGRPFWRDALGDVLVGGGVVAGVVGAVFLVGAMSADDAAANAATYDEFATNHEDAGSKRTIGAIAVGAGIGLVVVGGIRWWMVSKHHRPERSTAVSWGAGVTPGGFGVYALGHF